MIFTAWKDIKANERIDSLISNVFSFFMFQVRQQMNILILVFKEKNVRFFCQ